MEDSNYSPLPPPRNNVNMRKKTPVPLPRKNVNINNSDSNDGSSSTSSDSKGINVLLPETMMASEHGIERKKSFIENTRSKSICIEKSFRNLLPRRYTISQNSQTSEDFRTDISESSFDNDIFSTLSFGSPIPSDSNSERSFSYYTASEFYNSQPPNFPPPPLPQDVYDTLPRSSNSSSQCGSFSTENIFDFILTGQTKSLAYENWNPTSEKSYSPSDTSNIDNETIHSKSENHENLHETCLFNNEKTPDDTKFDILQFDPLHITYGNLSDSEKKETTDCLLLKEIDDALSYPLNSHYNITESKNVMDNDCNFEDTNKDLIPESPDHLDTTQPSCKSFILQTNCANNIDCREEIQVDPIFKEKPRKNSIKRWISTFKKVAEKPEDKIDIIDLNKTNMYHNGILLVSYDEKNKDFEQKWCQIVEGEFQCMIKQTPANQTGYSISIESLLSIQSVDEPNQKDGNNIFCFKLQFKSRPQPILLGASCNVERYAWMQKFLGSATALFPHKICSKFSRARCATLKEGINGEWRLSWILLHNRELAYTKQACGSELIDLRKVRNVVIHKDEDLGKSVLVIDYITKYIYLKFEEDSDILKWKDIIKAETLNTGPQLKDQQLSMDQVPVIVEKCVNFIYAHGYFTEGIYRRSGSVTNTTELLSLFLKDAWDVELKVPDYSVFDVASALKRFFRDLPEPVFTSELHMHLCNAVKCKCPEDKVILYRSILERLPDINYVTVRKLLSHLYYIQLQNKKNLMTAENLSSIWGPTLMHIEDGGSQNWSERECEVIKDLILLYTEVFSVEEAEMEREDRLMEALIQHNLSNGKATQLSKPSGDFIYWIYINKKDGDCFSVTLSPNKTALMVCNELANKLGVCGGYLLGLQELIGLNGKTLKRPIHHTECLLNVVLMWSYWDEEFKKDSCIVCVKPNSLLIEIEPFAKQHKTICTVLKFADQKSKSFKPYLFEITDGKLICYKDKSGSSSLHEWFVKDLIWYIGYEPKRNPDARWCITFILKNDPPKTSKDYFGWAIAGSTKEDHLQWMAALLIAQHGIDQISPPVIHNLLDY